MNQINLMTGNFLTMFDVPYIIQVFAENDIGESAGSNTIVFTRISSEYLQYIRGEIVLYGNVPFPLSAFITNEMLVQ